MHAESTVVEDQEQEVSSSCLLSVWELEGNLTQTVDVGKYIGKNPLARFVRAVFLATLGMFRPSRVHKFPPVC